MSPESVSPPRRIKIFDTTLRDGEQSPGASMTEQEKIELAHALEDLGVDIIEGGFPIASEGDFSAVRKIAMEIREASVCGLARCNTKDIDRAWEALQCAKKPRIHVFLATSPIHREYKLKKSPGEIIDMTRKGVAYAARYCRDIEFSPEDAARTEFDFLVQVVEAAIESGATTVNIPDTVGYALPWEMADRIARLNKIVGDRAVISVHCHDDLGMATANSLAAIENGAGQIECTINGIGERAGNCPLEEVVMAIRTRYEGSLSTGIHTQRLVPTSRLLTAITGLPMARGKAIVGPNAFAHESGIHQDGMEKHSGTYEIMRPGDVGWGSTELVPGKHSGAAGFQSLLGSFSLHPTAQQLETIIGRFKAVADQRKSDVDVDDLLEIAVTVMGEETENGNGVTWELVDYEASSSLKRGPRAKVVILNHSTGGTSEQVIEGGDGPIDALRAAISQVTGVDLSQAKFSTRAISPMSNAQGLYTVQMDLNGMPVRGRGLRTDTLHAATEAMLSLCNRIQQRQKRMAKSTPAPN